MRNFTKLNFYYLVILLLIGALPIAAQNTISGTVLDRENNEALVGATVIIQGTSEGTTTNIYGEFSLTSNKSLPWRVAVSYIGYETQLLKITESQSNLTVSLKGGLLLGREIVVSASRREERILETPASVSVLMPDKVAASGGDMNPLRGLVNTPGIQLQQQSAEGTNITMRGNALLFNTGTFIILDYRSLIAPGLARFNATNSPLNAIDIKQVEVVRGPGAALYGPGVTSGVVHYISKNPIDYPGTTVELIGGELSTFKASVRHAGRNDEQTFGYKINASYKRGKEFTLDGTEGTTNNAGVFTSQLDKFQTSVVSFPVNEETGLPNFSGTPDTLLTTAELDPDGDGNMLKDNYFGAALNATLEFRPKEDMSIMATGGWNQGSIVFYNTQGEGLMQDTEYYGQIRFKKGGLTAQAYVLNNSGGSDENPVFLYQTGLETRTEQTQIEGQVKYDFEVPKLLNSIWTAGVDYRNALINTDHQVHGRNENDDDYRLIGAYLQGKLELDAKLDLVLAGRFDNFSFNNSNKFSPRAALVYKPNNNHTVRATFNQATSPNDALILYLDLPLSRTPVVNLWGIGNIEEQTFPENPNIDWIIPGVPNTPLSAGFPLAAPYGAVTESVISGLNAAAAENPDLEAALPMLTGLLQTNSVAGFTDSLLLLNIFNNQPLEVLNAPQNEISIETTYELGYKGLINEKLSIGLDLYYFQRKNFRLFAAISPLVIATNIPNALGANVQTTFQPLIEQSLIDSGIDAEIAAAQAESLAGVLGASYTGAGTAFVEGLAAAGLPFHGVVPTEQVPQDGFPQLAVGYRTFDRIDYFGADLSLEYQVMKDLSVFANYSWLSETDFEPTVLGTGGTSQFALGIPDNKFRFGVSYNPEVGVHGNLSYQHDEPFNSNFGQFGGLVPAKNIVDMGIGYSFDGKLKGLMLDVTATNLFNSEYRAYPNFPVIGRRILGKLTYNFGADKS